MASEGAIIGGAILTFITVLLLLILVPLHFSYVDRGNYGLKRNTVTNDIDRSTVYENGRFATGVSFGMVEFPSTKIRIDFTGTKALSVFTEAGQTIYVGFIFYYRLIKDSLPQLYDAFGLSYENRIISMARAELRNAAPQFTLDNYTANRISLSRGFYTHLSTALRTKAFVEVDDGSFFLAEIILPTSVAAQKVTVFQTTQNIVTQGYTLTANETRLVTKKNVTAIDNEAEIIRQNATAEATRQVTEANARHFSLVQREIGLQLSNMSQRLGITDSNVTSDLIRFNQLLDRTKSSSIVTGLKSALLGAP